MNKTKIISLALIISMAPTILSTNAFAINSLNSTKKEDVSNNTVISAFKEPVNYSFDNVAIDSIDGDYIPRVPMETWIDFSLEGRGQINNPVNMKSITKDTVYFTDINGNKLPSILKVQQFDERGFSIKIVDKYVKVGEVYTLNLTKGITRKKGDSLYPNGYKLSVVTAPKNVNRSIYSSYNNFNLFNKKYDKKEPLTIEILGDNTIPFDSSNFNEFRIRTSEAVDIADLKKHVFLIDPQGKKHQMKLTNYNGESAYNRSIDNCEYVLYADTSSNLKFQPDSSYTIVFEKGIKSWLNGEKALERDIKINFKTNKPLDINTPIKEVGLKTSNSIYHKRPLEDMDLRVLRFLNTNGTRVETVSDKTGEKYIVNFVNRYQTSAYVGSTLRVNTYSYPYYFENGQKVINLDYVQYANTSNESAKYIKNIRPTYTTIKTKQGTTVSALDFNGDLYIIANNPPIDKELLGIKFPVANYNVLPSDFKNTEIDNPKVKGYVGIQYEKMNNYRPAANLNNVLIGYDNLSEVVSGILYENKDTSVKAPYYIKTKTGKKYYIHHHGKNVSAYTWYSLANENQFGLNKTEMQSSKGKNVIVRGIIKNDTEIMYPTVWNEIIANGLDKGLCTNYKDMALSDLDNTNDATWHTITLETGKKAFEGFDSLSNFKKYDDGTYVTTSFMSDTFGYNVHFNYDKIVMLTDKYTSKEVLNIMEKAIKNNKPNNFILKGVMLKNVDGKTILYITDLVDNTNKPTVK